MNRILLSMTLASALVLPPALCQAQWSVGPHIVISAPTSDFANVSEVGGGLGLKGIYQVSKFAHLSLRSDFSFISYGGTKFKSVTVNGGGPFPAQSRNESFRLIFGPQVSFGKRPIKFQLFSMGGFYFFRENLTITDGFFVVQDSRENSSELGWNFGGGIQYDIGLGPWLDISVEYNTIKNISGPPVAGDEQAPRPDIDANEITIKMGVIFFLGK
ncbi:MAG: outer membrane beta-barrel protein [bacterium]